jgi:hypothetical protein
MEGKPFLSAVGCQGEKMVAYPVVENTAPVRNENASQAKTIEIRREI